MSRRGLSVRGLTLIELMIVIALMTIISGIAAPQVLAALDAMRTSAAARYLAGKARLARFEAVKRSAPVAIVFDRAGDSYSFAGYLDRNGNGVRRADIARGTDVLIFAPERLEDQFPGVRFGIRPEVAPVDPREGATTGADPIRLGRSDILTFTPDGTSSSGTLYIHGRTGRQYALRMLGATGRTRILEFNTASREWLER